MSKKILTGKNKIKSVTKYETVTDKEFWQALNEVNRRYGKALADLARE